MRLTPVRAFAPALVLLAVALGGCSGSDGDDAGSGSSAVSGASDLDAPADGVRGEEAPQPASEAERGVAYDASQASSDAGQPDPLAVQRAVIRKGNVALRADNVGKAQFEVQQVVDEYAGRVTEEETTTDDEGNPAYTRMVLRIPSGRFNLAMEELKGIAELETANTSEDDVTTKLIDTRTRIEVQRRSIARISLLFDRAQSIRDIMAIEAQLSQRQADLDSLERQAAYLSSQTTLSTITVSIEQIPEKKAEPKPEEDEAGFVTGFKAGWHGLTAFAVGLATVLGALLPWLVVVAILGPPTLLLVRAIRRRRTHPEEPAPVEG